MNKYNPDSVHKRVDYIQYIYKNKDYPNNFEYFILPIAIYDRTGIIAGANKKFRNLVRITEDNIQNGTVNIFDCLDDKQTRLVETVHNTFDGGERIYKGVGSLIKTEEENPGIYELSCYPNAIFFPIARDRDGISLAGILLDENKTDDTAAEI